MGMQTTRVNSRACSTLLTNPTAKKVWLAKMRAMPRRNGKRGCKYFKPITSAPVGVLVVDLGRGNSEEFAYPVQWLLARSE
jgi:hypothetical protein